MLLKNEKQEAGEFTKCIEEARLLKKYTELFITLSYGNLKKETIAQDGVFLEQRKLPTPWNKEINVAW